MPRCLSSRLQQNFMHFIPDGADSSVQRSACCLNNWATFPNFPQLGKVLGKVSAAKLGKVFSVFCNVSESSDSFRSFFGLTDQNYEKLRKTAKNCPEPEPGGTGWDGVGSGAHTKSPSPPGKAASECPRALSALSRGDRRPTLRARRFESRGRLRDTRSWDP